MDKRDRAILFRERLSEAMAHLGMSRSALARQTNVDRSTIGQLLKDTLPRLPNAQLAADAASALGVSVDWLLGLTDRPERPGDILASSLALSPAERSAADAQILDWHREAAGYKIRHVPATIPDMLKTEAMLRWEYSSFFEHASVQAIDAMQELMSWLRDGQSDYEIAMPIHELKACASGSAYYEGVSARIRHEQLVSIARSCEEIYPRLRLFLFDARQIFSAPVTILGPKLAVIYIGEFYLAFRESSRIASLTSHFDHLVREACVDPREVPGYIDGLIAAEGW
ncbi:helix-turn-helix transcriptional regulator [uncultured Cohaesibacter sp.]|uniref:helix-turn-helix domain-containing protein n=1 Tax=uncultured Cohaesibacter sp. TaxID=1002546 RepID=UPI002930C04F|nr:helix-turn-helix transcriptional regulator [uncultured Cohaesibacter sp.]